MAESFGVPAKRVFKPSELRAAIREALDTPGPYLLDVMVGGRGGGGCRWSAAGPAA